MKFVIPMVIVTVLGVALSAAAGAETPRVVASIKPVHSLVAGVMADIGEPHLLVRGRTSAHDLSLKPSDVQALAEASLVFWIGPGLETPLVRPLESLADKARVVPLSKLDGLTRLPRRAGGAWSAASGNNHEHEPGSGFDMHIWLDPANAVVMVAAIVDHLATADPSRATAYRSNAAAVTERLNRLDEFLRDQLAGLSDRPYVVHHDAYRYLEERYRLKPLGALSRGGHQPPGAARLRAVRRLINDEGVVCLFAGPQSTGRSVAMLGRETGIRTEVLDPLGSAIVAGPGHYVRTMRDMAAALRDCLAPPS
jgi:zinc transport system substrate-binding protein